MSGVNTPLDGASSWPTETGTTPRALADLSASLHAAGASATVTQALGEAWQAMHASQPQRTASWRWPVLGAVAALAIAVVWFGWGRSTIAPDSPMPEGLVAAVPGGPFEPPPVTTAVTEPPATVIDRVTPAVDERAPAVVPADRTGRRPRAGRRAAGGGRPEQVVARAEPEPFVWIRGADGVELGLGLQIVRMQVPRLRWAAGMPTRELVEADVLMGTDGQARAVRVVRTGGP